MAFKCLLTAAGLVAALLVSAQTAGSQTDSVHAQSSSQNIDIQKVPITNFPVLTSLPPVIPLPVNTQGAFCDFEDAINRNRRLRIDFGVK